MGDWGTIAIGTRIGQAADPWFLWSWSNLICALRSDDIVLAPAIGLPHHAAATALMQQAIAEGVDALLIVDDDSVFTVADIDRLRSDGGGEYGAVSALMVSQTRHQRPVAVRRSESGYEWHMDLPESGLWECDVVGFGCTIISTEAMRSASALANGRGICHWGDDGSGEDCVFSSYLKRAGFRLAVNCGVQVGHRFPEIHYWRPGECAVQTSPLPLITTAGEPAGA